MKKKNSIIIDAERYNKTVMTQSFKEKYGFLMTLQIHGIVAA